MEEKKPSCAPSMSWWIVATVLSEITQSAAKTYYRITGMTNLVSRQSAELAKFVQTLNRLSGCKGPVTEDELSVMNDWDQIVEQKYIVQKSAIRNFLSGLGTFVHAAMNELPPENLDEVVNKVGVMFLSAIVRLSRVISEQDSSNLSSSCLPPVLPRELVLRTRAAFNDDVRNYANRLSKTMTLTQIDQIEEQFGELAEAFHDQETFRECLTTGEQEQFMTAWGALKFRFPQLHAYSGGLATVYPEERRGTQDRSTMSWETDIFRESSAKDFALEGSLHCKQYWKLSALLEKVL